MIARYGEMRDRDPDGLWGDQAHAWTRAVFSRSPFLSLRRRRELWSRYRGDDDFGSWVGSPAFPSWVYDVVAEDGRPPGLSLVRIATGSEITLVPGQISWILPGQRLT